MTREFDLVIFGATGFTGRLMVEYLAKQTNNKCKWAVAGRDSARLTNILKKNNAEGRASVITASVDNQQSINSMCSRTRAVLNAVGPFLKYGEPVVKGCVNEKCHYLDITGEPAFINLMIEKYHEQAKKNNVKIVHCVGLDSVPADLGAQFVLEQLKVAEGTSLKDSSVHVESFIEAYGQMSFGTFSTIVTSLNNVSIFDKKEKSSTPKSTKSKKVTSRGIGYEPFVQSYVVPFSSSDPTIVKRSALLEKYHADGQVPFTYGHYLQVKKWYNLLLIVLFGLTIFVVTRFPYGAALLMYLFTKLKGESLGGEEASKDGYFLMPFRGTLQTSEGSKVVACSVGAKGDPGYGETSKWAVEAALCLLFDVDDNKNGGVITPASSMGKHLRARLEKIGMHFEVTSTTKPKEQ
ncbi:saccharopine dehydrogenase-like oxidoreductase [Acrasis kona]|uniref:Saccharopine dehydrogenase-like oxidoreductase n=1 Tax=Acrasis kona TaxID=1008807 RepID=A0AAW2Z4Q3_9EUKA